MSKFPISTWVPLHCFNVYIIFLYMTIFKVYLLDFYPRVVETRHPYPSPVPTKPVPVCMGTGFHGYRYGFSWRYPGVTRAIH